MILSKNLIGERFSVITTDTRTKQEVANLVPHKALPIKNLKLVAQKECENIAGYEIEDEEGNIHIMSYKFYVDNKIDELMLPLIQYPKPEMTIEDALIAIVKFAPDYAKRQEDHSFQLSSDYVKAREILGKDAAKKLLENTAQIYKTR